jgi:hypothetical protein
MPLFNIPLRDTIPTACPDCHQLKRQFYVLGFKDLICLDCATNSARDFESNFDAIFNAPPRRPADPAPIPVNELKNGEFIRFTGHAKKPTIYEKIGYDRSTRRYMLQCVDDISRLRFIKGSTRVYPTDY